ncbi:myosin-3 [Anabrus simplex]|uniref:myosin-3 n=1 Tax=Anabrus simplex TaxID=316456 RepID=UPI0035A33165
MLMEQTTERTSTATSGKQEDHDDVAFTPTISSTILSTLMEETTTKILAVTPEKLEDHTDVALIPTISSTNLSTLMEISTKGELNSSLNLEDMSDIPQPASSLLSLRVQMPKIGEKKQDNSSHKQKQFLVKQSIDHSVSQVELTTQRTSTVASQKQEDHTDVTYMPTISSTNLSTLNVITMDKKRDPSSHQHGELSTVVQSTSSSNVEMEVAAEKNEGDLYQSLEDSSDVPNNTTSSENDLIVQMDPTNNGPQGNFSHNWEVTSIKTNSLNISTSDLNEQVDQGVEKEHKTNSHDIHPSASNSDAQVGMAANWELQKIPDKLKDLFVLISNMNFSASNTNEQMELTSGKEHDNSSTNKQEDHIHVLHNLNMSPKNLAAQMELAADEEQDNLSHKQKDLSDIPEGLNLSASNVNTEMGLTTIVPQQNSSHKLAVRSDFPRSLNISDSQFYAQIELSTEKEQEILPRKQKDLSDKVNTMNISASNLSAQVEVAVQNEQDNASQKQIDHSSSRSHVQMELADDKEHDSPSHEQDDTSDMPYNLNISSSNLDVQMEPLKQDKSYQKESYDGEPINMDLSASNLDVQMMEPADEEKDNSQQQENFYDMPFDLDQSALNTKEQMLEPTNEDEDNSHEEQFSLDLPVDLDQSASFITPQLPPQAEEKEIEDINEHAFEMYPSSGNRNLRTQAKIREHKDINEAPFDQHQSASNVNLGIPAEFEEDQDLNDGYFDAEESTNYENLGISREIRKHKDRYDEHFDVGQSPNDVNMETPAKEKEYEPFDTQPIAMKYPSNNARVEQTTEVERERFHKAEDIYGFGRSAEKMEQTTEVKQERFQNTENVYDLGRSASEVHVQVAPLAEEERSYSVKPKGFNKKPPNFEYSTSKVNMDKLRNHQQNSLKEEDFYDVTPQTDQFADNLKVQYLVMSFNETKQNGVPKGNIINDIQERNISCPAEFAVLPDPDGDCNVYYICHNWTLERRTCSKDLHFNPINRVCDYPGKAVCDLKCVEENDRYHVPGYCNMYLDCVNGEGRYVRCSDGLHFNAITKQCDGPTKAACDIACPHYNTLVALPGRCNMYAICDEGNVTYHLCPPGLHFNPVTLKCDVPETEQCKIECLSANGYFPVLGQCMNYIECQNNHGKVISCPSGLHFNFLLQTCDVPSQAGCEMKCKEPNGYFPFPGVCSYFIMCVNGTPFLKKCPGDLEYNEDTHQCDIVTKNHCMPYCPMENGIFPVDNHCDLYMRCTHGQPLVKRCPQGLHFNALFKHCDLPENAKCELPCPFLSGMFPVPGKCNKFIRCENGVASTYSCAEGLHFNARTQTCDWPPSAQCDLSCPEWDGYFAVQGACNAYVMCNEGRPTLKKCPPGRHFNLEAKHCDYPEYANCEFVCPESDGLFAYRGHCDSYIHCENGKPHIDTCPPGLLFNIETAVCDLADNVRCYG